MMAETTSLTVQSRTHFKVAARGRKWLASGEAPAPVPLGHIPRIARMMALAIRFDELVRQAEVRDYAELDLSP
jgi:hypothetical protein